MNARKERNMNNPYSVHCTRKEKNYYGKDISTYQVRKHFTIDELEGQPGYKIIANDISETNANLLINALLEAKHISTEEES